MKSSAFIFFLILFLSGLTACNKINDDSTAPKSLAADQLTQARPLIDDSAPSRELTIVQPKERKWWHDSVTYQIWPRSFYDSNGDGNGDFIGMAKKISYLKDLGISAVWLTPVLESPSYHGYDTSNFYAIEKDYGTEAEFEAFLQQAKKANIKVIMDLVINHVSDQHPWFVKSVNKEPGFEDFFIWSPTLPANYGSAWSDVPNPNKVWHYNDTRKEYYYGVFGYSQPDLNLRNQIVISEVKNVAAHWIRKGVDGFRLDAVRYLIEEGGIPLQADTKSNYGFLVDFSAHVKAQNPNAYLIGEAFTDNSVVATYFNDGKGIDAAFDFDFSMNVGKALEVKPMLITPTDEDKANHINLLREAFWVNLTQRNTTNAPGYFFAPFINNHDSDRLMVRMDNNIVRATIAAGLLLTSPGSPYIYYGEEIGMSQFGLFDDMYRRSIMQWDGSPNAGFNTTGERWLDEGLWFPWKENFEPWWEGYWSTSSQNARFNVNAQTMDDDSLLSFYKKLIALRNKDIVLRSPHTIKLYDYTGNAWVVKYTRDNISRWIILNLDATNSTTFNTPPVLHGAFLNLLNEELITNGSEFSIKAGELLILSSDQI